MTVVVTSILRTVRVRALMAGGLCVLAVAGGAGYVLSTQREDAQADLAPASAQIADWRWAPRDELPTRAEPAEDEAETEKAAAKPKPKRSRKRTQRAEAAPPVDPMEAQSGRDLDEVEDLASGAASDKDEILIKAEVLKNGVALPPLEAPAEVKAIFEAGNVIARSPYIWGGGHGKWQDKGYDCSGSVSYALAAGGFLDSPLASGPLMRWGKPGKGKWITIYTNPGHVFMVVAGVRFDTVARGQTGSRWINDMTSTSGYVARHPPGF
jgi:cell wall-associated NlpC family hydrolase